MARERMIIVGAGSISGAWLPHIVKEELQVKAVVDLRKEAAETLIEKHKLAGAKAYTSVDEALKLHAKDADFLLDLTVPEAHEEVTTKALKAGLHVVGEKPMASSMASAKRMIAASEAANRLYMVSQSRRWDPLHETVVRTVRSEKLGTPTTLNCDFFIGAHFGGFRDVMEHVLLLDMAIHHFDLARKFSGCDPVAVYAEEFNPAGSWYKGAASANCLFEMTNGVRFIYRGSWCSEGFRTSWNGSWRVIGKKGTLLLENDKTPTAEVVAKQEGFFREMAPLAIEPAEVPHTAMYGGLMQMLRFLRTREKPETECHDNIKSLAMVFAAIESATTSKRVAIHY